MRCIPKFLLNTQLMARLSADTEVLHDGEGVVTVVLPDAVVTIKANKEGV